MCPLLFVPVMQQCLLLYCLEFNMDIHFISSHSDFGPYTLDFSLSGRYMIAAGRKGHIALLDMKNMELIKEFQVLCNFLVMFIQFSR